MSHDTIEKNGWLGVAKGMPAVGASAERSKLIEKRFIDLFADMTGDHNPLHFDQAAAEKSVFGGLIVQGGVTSGLLNAVVAEDLPGPGSVFLGVAWNFVKAVYPGDTITAQVTVTEVRVDKPICKIETTIRNQKGETCLSGTATTYTVALKNN
jgi:acyl dehydratase